MRELALPVTLTPVIGPHRLGRGRARRAAEPAWAGHELGAEVTPVERLVIQWRD